MNFLARAVLFLTGLGFVIYSVHRYEVGHSQTPQVIYVSPPALSQAQPPQSEQTQSEVADGDAPVDDSADEQPCDGCAGVSTENPAAQTGTASPTPSQPNAVYEAQPVEATPARVPPAETPPPLSYPRYSEAAPQFGYGAGTAPAQPSPYFPYGRQEQANTIEGIRPTAVAPFAPRFVPRTLPGGVYGYGAMPPHHHRR